MKDRAKNMLRRMLRWAAYPAFFFASFFFFAYLTFPYDRVKEWAIEEVENPQGSEGQREPSGYQLEIISLEPSFVTGVEATGVRLIKLPEDPEERAADVTFEHIDARVSLLSLLAGDLAVSFDTRVGGGDIEGELTVGLSGDSTALEMDFSEVHLRRLGVLRSALGLPVGGSASGAIDVTLGSEPSATSGTVSVQIAGLSIGDGTARLRLEGMGQGLTIDQMEAGDLNLDLTIEEGIATIGQLRSHGADAELDGEGTIRVMSPVTNSRLDLLVRAKFTDAYREKSSRTAALFALLEVNPRMRAARTTDGALQYRVSGSLGARIQTQGAGRATAPGASE